MVVVVKMVVEDVDFYIIDVIVLRVGVWVGFGIGGFEILEF